MDGERRLLSRGANISHQKSIRAFADLAKKRLGELLPAREDLTSQEAEFTGRGDTPSQLVFQVKRQASCCLIPKDASVQKTQG